MKNFIRYFIVAILLSPVVSEAQSARKTTRPVARKGVGTGGVKQQLSAALKLARDGQYAGAAAQLYTLSKRKELVAERPQIKYILGTMLVELKLYQTAAFQFVEVIRSKDAQYTKMAVEKLSIVADILGDDTILNYALSKVDLQNFPANQRDMINYRLAEISQRNGNFQEAIAQYLRVSPKSSYYSLAMFNKGIAELEMNNTTNAIRTYKRLLGELKNKPVTDNNRVAAQMGLARALYQNQDWDGAVATYSSIPRDTTFWHDAVFEQSWAMLRGARFRSALSNFQTIHSAYYEDFYMPESLLLRSIIYLYICKYDEMDKVLGLFEKTYGPVRAKVGDFIKSTKNPESYYVELQKAYRMKTTDSVESLRLPYVVLRYSLDQGDVKRSMSYLNILDQERKRIDASNSFKASALGKYALKIVKQRSTNTKLAIGDMLKVHLLNIRAELKDLYEQAGFIRYEMINGKKETLKKQIAGNAREKTINSDIDRSFYVENGYEYYPFQGEYWHDEIGNYHYLGKQSCE